MELVMVKKSIKAYCAMVEIDELNNLIGGDIEEWYDIFTARKTTLDAAATIPKKYLELINWFTLVPIIFCSHVRDRQQNVLNGWVLLIFQYYVEK